MTSAEKRGIAAQQLRVELALRQILKLFDQCSIEVIVLKGPHLGATVYGDPLERTYCDLDLLVRPRHFDEAVGRLAGAGYRHCIGDAARPATEQMYYCWMFSSPGGVVIELHRDLSGHARYPVSIDGLFDRARPIKMGRVAPFGLSDEDLLVHLCIHIAKSNFLVERKHVRDIEKLTRSVPLDWTKVLDRLREAECTVGGFYSLTAARAQTGANVPERITSELEPEPWRKALIERWLEIGGFPMYRGDNGLGRSLLGMLLLDDVGTWGGAMARYAGVRLKDLTYA